MAMQERTNDNRKSRHIRKFKKIYTKITVCVKIYSYQ